MVTAKEHLAMPRFRPRNIKPLIVRTAYAASMLVVHPLNWLLASLLTLQPRPKSVLHVSYMVHEPWHMTRILRKYGWHNDYMALGDSPHWNRCDHHFKGYNPLLAPWYEFYFFWTVLARYEAVHFHFMITMTRSGWEVPLLKRLGRRVVAHYLGCEARNRELNMRLHPALNICQQCDYNATICTSPLNRDRRALAARWADATMVTTPDMRDFMPEAVVSSFFAPDGIDAPAKAPWDGRRPLKLVHVTNHPGIEGTERIQKAVEAVRARGHDIEFVYLRNVPHSEVMAAMREADLAIGKMKMGYYANAQIESMICGVPTITWIRPDFMTDALRESGFIICHLDDLEQTLLHYLSDPEALARKQSIARSSIRALHDESAIAKTFIACYAGPS
ncbi:glycosyltransferase [Agrobacterium sp. RAC06]|uniref:glycosyltransferase n=2 Tax=unclassified Agrobacterium TaxID=2632611 RepID=UPI0012374735|nr:glycosyltransferase [Agrobacterium sp. RAC06]